MLERMNGRVKQWLIFLYFKKFWQTQIFSQSSGLHIFYFKTAEAPCALHDRWKEHGLTKPASASTFQMPQKSCSPKYFRLFCMLLYTPSHLNTWRLKGTSVSQQSDFTFFVYPTALISSHTIYKHRVL